ncbi:MAG: YkgJ family cysteine cluster protein [Planctomycetes bacterium]|nr:YkgJ family cysteine cluster protein [Planctomycetota bacterium]
MGNDEAREELAQLYRDLAVELSELGVECTACGKCCHFDEMEHILYATMLEAQHLLRLAGNGVEASQLRCPYQVEEKCTAREGRPLGCRLHFCKPSPEQDLALEEISARHHRKLQDIHERNNIEWDYRPLLAMLRDLISGK